MHSSTSKTLPRCLAVLLGLGLRGLPAAAATYTFTNDGGDRQYTNAQNWSGGVVPNTANGDTAIISSNGTSVTYTPGGDLTIANGGSLQITNGSFTQVGGNNYLQLAGNASILVNGGTFNQGTISSNPFNLSGTNNAFTLTAGAVNLNKTFNIDPALTFMQSGGTFTVTGGETRFNGGGATLSGGSFTTSLITGVNGPAGNHIFNISGGALTLTSSDFNGIYGGGTTQYINFTPGSTGQIIFSSGQTTVANVQAFINNGVIEYNGGGTGTLSNFNITRDDSSGIVTLSLLTAVPEPATCAAGGLLVAFALPAMTRRLRRRAI